MDIIDYKNIPIYITSYNRLTDLQKLISYLEKHNYKNIKIIDNASTYPPLLEYLDNLPYKVHKMPENFGHIALFKVEAFKNIVENEYFVLTDPDVVPIDECPDDFMEKFMEILQDNREITKVGFSLKIDDLPDHNKRKDEIIKWEKQFYEYPFEYKGLKHYLAQIDTTFALYRPIKDWYVDPKIPDYPIFFKGIRTGFPYTARHLSWYLDLENLSDEMIFYNNLDTMNIGTWNNNESTKDFDTKTELWF